MALASDFSLAIELWVLTHNHKKNQDGFSLRFFNSKGAVGFNPQLYKKLKALASDFSIAKEQVLLTPALKPIFQYFWSMFF